MRPAKARQPIIIFIVKLVVVGQLFAAIDPPVGEDDDVHVSVDLHHLGDAVRVARVVDVPGHVARHCRV